MGQEIRFGGAVPPTAGSAVQPGAASLPRNSQEFQQRYAKALERRPAWVKVLEQAANQLRSTPEGRTTYGDPEHGATLPQAWNMQFAMSGQFNVCLLARGRPATPMDGIPQVILMGPADLTAALARGFSEIEPFAVQIFVHDGRSGHSVTLRGHDAGNGFTYLDPWPERSLLCREFNVAGVDAQPAEDGLWRITDAELAKVIFAAFVMPTHWAELSGCPYRVQYGELQQSDFWKFFHLRETERRPENNRTVVTLQPGGFQQELDLRLALDGSEAVRHGWLSLRRGWIVGPPQGVNPLAIDIAKSFLGALLPPPDQAAGAVYVQAIAGLRARSAVQAVAERRAETDLSTAEALQLTYLGLRPDCDVLLPFCQIHARNADRPGAEAWLELEVDLF